MLYARVRSTLLAATAAFLLIAPAAAEARDATVTSFDGTKIALSFFPAEGLAAGQRAPTILEGHGWGSSRDTNENSTSTEALGQVGLGPLRRAGFNVLTWDARGWGQSGGTIEVDSKDFEARDVSALISWLAKQPEARLDAPGDPRVGMTGVSYAGGIQLVTAATDKRVDAISPVIAWHSLTTSLYKTATVKGGWSSILYAAAAGHKKDPHIDSAFTSGLSTGTLSPADRDWFASRGPGALVSQIHVPTLLVEGTADTLFTLQEAIDNYRILRGDGVPTKMVWFCGGHGVCLTGSGPAGHLESDVIAWLKRYVAGDRATKTGPGFEWLADDAKWRSAPSYPPRAGGALTATGSGTLTVSPADAISGTPVAAGPAANAVNVAIPAPSRAVQVLGAPRLSLTYSGTSLTRNAHVFAQIVDTTRGVVLGNQATPMPLTLDGAAHTLTQPLEVVAAAATPASRYTLQIIGGTQVYGPVHVAATVNFSSIGLRLPTVGSASAASLLPSSRRCLSGRRFTIRLRNPRGTRLRSARVFVNGRRLAMHRRHGRLVGVARLRGRSAGRVRVRVVAKTVKGRTLRQTRSYRRC
jgi:ABC-2 type transport system ATP-binding protein